MTEKPRAMEACFYSVKGALEPPGKLPNLEDQALERTPMARRRVGVGFRRRYECWGWSASCHARRVASLESRWAGPGVGG